MTLRPRTHGKSAFSRDAWLEVDLNAVEHNYKQIRANLKPDTKLMAVVKSDAYGHGASILGPLLEALGTECFGVASVDEGIQLREAGVKTNILILSPTPSWALPRAIDYDLEITISSSEQIQELEKLKLQAQTKKKEASLPIKIQIKLNTGMNRNGSKWNTEATDLIKLALSKTEMLEVKGVYSHFACNGNAFFTEVQLDRFRTIISEFKPSELGLLHIGASSTFTNREYLHFDMVRVGLSLFGLGEQAGLELKPAMSLIARISQIQRVQIDEGVGYNLTWTASRDSIIGLLPFGYADGIKRGLSNRIKAIYKDKLIEQVGSISMDQTSFDFTDCEDEPKVGDLVTIIGKSENEELSMKEWAQILGTIEYEIACDLRARLPRVYVRK
jgi:alanine racemase